MNSKSWDDWARATNQKRGYGYARMSGGGFDPAFPVYDTRTTTDQSTGASKYYKRQAGTEGDWQETGAPNTFTSFGGGPALSWEQQSPEQRAIADTAMAKVRAANPGIFGGTFGQGSQHSLAPEVLAKMWK